MLILRQTWKKSIIIILAINEYYHFIHSRFKNNPGLDFDVFGIGISLSQYLPLYEKKPLSCSSYFGARRYLFWLVL